MIVRMKELWLFTLASTEENTVRELGELGVVDIREVTPPDGAALERIETRLQDAETALSLLAPYRETPVDGPPGQKRYVPSDDPVRLIDRIQLSSRIKVQCLAAIDRLQQDLQWYAAWGENIDLKDFAALREHDVYLRLYRLSKKELGALPQDLPIVPLAQQGDTVPVALLSRSAEEKLPVPEEPLPALPFAVAQQQLTRKQRQLQEVDRYLTDQVASLPLLRAYRDDLQDRLHTRQALEGMGDIEGQVKYLRGFLPQHAVDQFTELARRNRWGYHLTDPEDPEEVPVYIKNPKWVSIINPVLQFIDVVPGYKELDVSIYFLVAFALFFAMLVGDAGYGAVFLLATFLLRKKLPAQVRLLIYVLSGATIGWGVLSGTYFGSEQIAAIPVLNRLIIPQIASFGVDNISFLMHLSFLIGAIHLTIAHGVRVFQYLNSAKALSEIGWIAFVWGLFFLAEMLVLGRDMPAWNHWLFIGGAVLVTLFSREGKTPFGSILNSVANLPLNLINGFSDIVSYVRLFAVGMATATVAASFNQMILPADGAELSFLQLLAAAVALLLGHGLNIVLALMAVMVHGLRLNMLEFAGHLGVQFSGKAYRPFVLNAGRTRHQDEES